MWDLQTSYKERAQRSQGDLHLLVDQRVGGRDTGMPIQLSAFALFSLRLGMLNLGHITYIRIPALPLWSQVTCSWTGSLNFISPGFLTSKTGIEHLACFIQCLSFCERRCWWYRGDMSTRLPFLCPLLEVRARKQTCQVMCLHS